MTTQIKTELQQFQIEVPIIPPLLAVFKQNSFKKKSKQVQTITPLRFSNGRCYIILKVLGYSSTVPLQNPLVKKTLHLYSVLNLNEFKQHQEPTHQIPY